MKSIITLMLGLSPLCHARLGDTPEQCEKRYGTLVEKWHDGSWVKFAKGIFRVECAFKEGKCVMVAYQLANPSLGEILDYTIRFSEESRDLLLILNQGISRYIPWNCTTMTGFGTAMKTEDGKRRVFINQNEIRFEDSDYIEWRRTMASKDVIQDVVKEISK